MTLKAQSAQETETLAANIDNTLVEQTVIENSALESTAQSSQQLSRSSASCSAPDSATATETGLKFLVAWC